MCRPNSMATDTQWEWRSFEACIPPIGLPSMNIDISMATTDKYSNTIPDEIHEQRMGGAGIVGGAALHARLAHAYE